MRVWWLKGYFEGIYDLQYAAFVHYGEARATQAVEELVWKDHTFVIEEGWL